MNAFADDVHSKTVIDILMEDFMAEGGRGTSQRTVRFRNRRESEKTSVECRRR